MTELQALVLGLIQGLSEFLPISSSAHLALTPWFFGWQDGGLAFDVALHIGTLLAVAWYFRREWLDLLAAGGTILMRRQVRTIAERRAAFLVIATIPAGIVGLMVEDLAETTFRSPLLIAINLMVMGVLLWLVDQFSRRDRQLDQMTMRDAVAIGLIQCLALLPGVSRSGSTITAGRLLGFDRQAAAIFSFLMSFPTTLAAAAWKAPEAFTAGVEAGTLVIGISSAAVSSWVAIAILIRFVSRYSFGVFAAYRLVLGVIVLATIAARG
jgi:undecaprenyl-diphosphatase